MLCELGLDKNKFLQIRASRKLVGMISADVVHMTTLKQGIPVYVGRGEAVCYTRRAGIMASKSRNSIVKAGLFSIVVKQKN